MESSRPKSTADQPIEVIRFACPSCGNAVKAPPKMAYRVAICPKCRRQVTVPGPESVGAENAGAENATVSSSPQDIPPDLPSDWLEGVDLELPGNPGDQPSEPLPSGGEVDGERFEDLSTGDFGRWSDEVEKAPVAEEVEGDGGLPKIVIDSPDSREKDSVTGAKPTNPKRHWADKLLIGLTVGWIALEAASLLLVMSVVISGLDQEHRANPVESGFLDVFNDVDQADRLPISDDISEAVQIFLSISALLFSCYLPAASSAFVLGFVFKRNDARHWTSKALFASTLIWLALILSGLIVSFLLNIVTPLIAPSVFGDNWAAPASIASVFTSAICFGVLATMVYGVAVVTLRSIRSYIQEGQS